MFSLDNVDSRLVILIIIHQTVFEFVLVEVQGFRDGQISLNGDGERE